MENNRNNASPFLTGFFVGAVIGALSGAISGLLLAPQSGAETRKQLGQKAVEIKEKTMDEVENIADQMRPHFQKAKELTASQKEQLRLKMLDMLTEEDEEVVEKVAAKNTGNGTKSNIAVKANSSAARGRPKKTA